MKIALVHDWLINLSGAERVLLELHKIFTGEIASKRLMIVEGDIRDFDPESRLKAGDYVLAANIPYYITGEIIRTFLSSNVHPKTMALLVQKEVAERILARNGKESILSLSVKAYGTPKIVAKVTRGNFSPPPSVDSAILLIEHISRSFFEHIDEQKFFRLLHAGFSSKRKKLVNNLRVLADKEVVAMVFKTCAIDLSARAEDLSLEKWKCLTRELA